MEERKKKKEFFIYAICLIYSNHIPYFVPAHVNAFYKYADLVRQLSVPNIGLLDIHTIMLERDKVLGFGFSVTGETPVCVRNVRHNGPSDGPRGLISGDLIIKVQYRVL